MAPLPLLLLPLVGGSDAPAPAAEAGGSQGHFAEPVMLTAGEQPLGRGFLYPSPEMFDVDGDGRAEILFGDLTGRLYVTEKLAGDDPLAWSKPQSLKGADGKRLKFNNW